MGLLVGCAMLPLALALFVVVVAVVVHEPSSLVVLAVAGGMVWLLWRAHRAQLSRRDEQA